MPGETMGALHIQGRKGGSSKPKQAKEAKDSLRSMATAKILIAVGEGEFAGMPTAQDIYLDNTPLAGPDGTLNFEGVSWEWRPGSIDQRYIPGIPAVENETSLNVELHDDTTWVRSFSNTQLSALRLRFAWPMLQAQDSNGNINGYRIEYAVDVATDGGAFIEVLREAVDGKSTSRYERSRRIDLPPARQGWRVQVRRLTANAKNNRIADSMLLAGLTEVIDAKLRYPNTALLYVEFSAEQFSSIPTVTVQGKGQKWRVPSNYDPDAHTYDGVWDGTFKSAWTDNPAWICYGICVNDRFGLGQRIKPWMIDKWELYRIAQYCDQRVSDGRDGQETRFSCNLNLQARSDAWTLLRDLSAIYRGMSFWANGQLAFQADMPRATDFDYVFTRANVVDGQFSYAGGSARTRYTRALVSYDNPANNYDTDVTAYADDALTLRYGDRPVEISAIGCTRESEAARRGKWTVLTNHLDRTVSFATGAEGRIPLPGYIIPVADSMLAGREIGGRIAAVAGRVITLDRDTDAKVGDRLIINLPSGRAEARTVQSVSGRVLTVTTAYSVAPEAELVWALDAADLAVQLYRVLKVARDESGHYSITALQYEPSKYAHVDNGGKLEERPISVVSPSLVPAPAEVRLSAHHVIDQGIAVNTMTIAWAQVPGAVAYDVEWRKDGGNWVRLPRTGATSVDVQGIYTGDYLARVRAVGAMEMCSSWGLSALTTLTGKTGAPPALAYLRATEQVFGIALAWGFPVSGAEDCQRTELQYSLTQDGQGAQVLTELAYPTRTYSMMGLRAGQAFWFRGRLVDRSGNVGPWCVWVHGQASSDADVILEQIRDEIVSSELGKQLLEQIELIDAQLPVFDTRLSDQAAELLSLQREQAQQLALIADAEAVAAQNLARERSELAEKEAELARAQVTEVAARIEQYEALHAGQQAQAATLEVQKQATAEALARLTADLLAEVQARAGQYAALSSQVQGQGDQLAAQGQQLASDAQRIVDAADALAREVLERLHQGDEFGRRIVELAEQSGDLARQTRELRTRTVELSNTLVQVQETTAQHAQQLTTLESRNAEAVTRIATVEETTAQHALAVTHLQAVQGDQDAQLSEAREVSADHARQLTELRVSSGQQQAGIRRLDEVTATQATTLEQLGAKDAELAGSITSAQQASASLATRTIALETSSAGHAGRISTVETASSQQAARLTTVEATANNAQSTVASLTRTTGDLASRTGTLETAAAGQGARLVTVEQTGADHALAISHLQATQGDQDAQLTGTQEVTAEHARQLIELRVSDGEHSAGIHRLDDVTANQASALERLNAADAALASSITSAQQATAALATRTSVLETRDGQQSARISATEQTAAGLATRTGILEVKANAQASSITDLQTANAAQATSLQQVKTKAEGTETSVTTLASSMAGQGTRLAAVETRAGDNGAAITQLQQSSVDMALEVTQLRANAGEQDAQITESRSVTSTLAQRQAELTVQQADSHSRIVDIERVSADSASRLGIVETKAAGIDSRVTSVETASANLAQRAGTLESKSGEQSGRMANLEQTTTTTAQRTTALEVADGERKAQVLSLQQTDTEAALRSAWMQAANGEQEAQLAEVQRVAADSVTEARLLQAKTDQQQSQIAEVRELTATQASQQMQLKTSVGDLESWVGQLSTTQTGEAKRLDQVLATANNAATKASVIAEQTARADADSTLGKRIDTVQATADAATTSVQQTSQALATMNGKLSSLWTVKTEVSSGGKRVLAGIGVGVEATPSGMQSQVLVLADRFAVLNTSNAQTEVPFAIDGGQVFMREAFIRNASITNAKIADASITSAKIQTANIDTLHLKDGAVTLSAYASSNGFQRYFTGGSFTAANGLDSFSTLQFPTRWGDDVIVEGHFRLGPTAYNATAGRSIWICPALYLDGYQITDYAAATLEAFVNTQHIPITMRARIPGNGANRTLTLRIAWSIGTWKNPSEARYEVRHCILSAFISRK